MSAVATRPADLDVQPLTKARLPDLAALFDEGGDAKTCQCAFWRVPGSGWQDWTKAKNRAVLASLAGRDPAPGLVAYRDGRTVGWVSVGPREDYARLERSKVLARIDDKPVWSIVCFFVDARARGRGVSEALLKGAIDYARSEGATMLEAYPIDKKERSHSDFMWSGAKGMYDRAGFKEVARRKETRPVMRRSIRPRARPR
jgi:GNAT superfamily N-acetyltransferase